jgi:hypothetical protein
LRTTLPASAARFEAAQGELDRTTRDLEAVKRECDDLKVLIDRLPEER